MASSVTDHSTQSTPDTWSPSSWRSKTTAQAVDYPRELAGSLEAATAKLRRLPGLVTSSEVERLRAQLADVANNKAFLLHGGDCAELFEYCSERAIEQRISLLLLSSLVIVFGGRTPCVRILRGAGQYAKPRSKPTETVDGREVLSFRGENVNGIGLDDRTPDPDRLVQAYFHSAATINYIRALLDSGFADLHNPRSWKLSHVHNKELADAFDDIVERLEDSLDFLKVVGGESGTLQKADIWTSHEGLMLEFEEALTRSYKDASGQAHWYNTSAPFLWIGDRTRDIQGAHVEYFRGVRNPIGLKCGPSLEPAELIRLLDILDPDFEPGKVTLISRYGNHKVEECLPHHIKAVQSTRHRPVFCADIMHGNTFQASSGPYKTRHMADLCSELVKSWKIHRSLGSKLQGIHLEMTGDVDENGYSVTEIVGGSMERSEEDLPTRYLTFCDPRCSVEQTIDIAFLTADYLTSERTGAKKGSAILSHLTSRESSKSRSEQRR